MDKNTSDVHTPVAAIIEPSYTTHIKIPLKVEDDSIAPLTVLHLFWWATTSTHASFPKTFDCLIDVGSHLVIIWENLVNELLLCCWKLKSPIETKLAMDNDKNQNNTMNM